MRNILIAVTVVLFTFAAVGFAAADPCGCQGSKTKTLSVLPDNETP